MEKQKKEIFERLKLEIIAFETEDIVRTSFTSSDSGGDPTFTPGENEGPFVPA